MIQLHGSGALKTLGAAVKAGAFFGGGTYACYRYPPSAYEPPDPTQPPPLGQCANCNASSSCMTAGCSNKIRGITGLEPWSDPLPPPCAQPVHNSQGGEWASASSAS